jgi:hypothetical protein
MLDAARSVRPSLMQRPQVRSYMVEALLEDVMRGRVRVPPFQRGMKWDAGDVRKLLDSVRRGFPIGTLLLWKRSTPAEAHSFQLGPVRIDAPRSADAYWVVDGQQRITALTGTLFHPAPDYEKPPDDFEFYFDLDKGDFIRRSLRRGPSPSWLPMWELLDSVRLLKWLRQQGERLTRDAGERALELGKAFREYQVPAVIVESDSDEVVREIFERTNSAGRRLNQDEIFHALHAARPGESPRGLDEMAEILADLGFGNVRELPLRQAVLAVRGADPTRAVTDLTRDRQFWEGAIADATQAMRRVIIFLKRDARIPNALLLPYQFPVLPLVRFFHLFPEPRPRSRELLARWLWRTSATGTFGLGPTPVRRALRAVSTAEEASVQALLKLVGPDRPPLDPSTRFDLRTAETRLAALAMLAAGPTDLETGVPLDVETLLKARGDDAFARIFIRRPPDVKIEVTSVANRIISRRAGGSLLQQQLRTAASRNPDWLNGHVVPSAAREALIGGAWENFFELRSVALRGHIERYVETRARWGETDRPSLAALVAEADE